MGLCGKLVLLQHHVEGVLGACRTLIRIHSLAFFASFMSHFVIVSQRSKSKVVGN
jgi:hypothetical protein